MQDILTKVDKAIDTKLALLKQCSSDNDTGDLVSFTHDLMSFLAIKERLQDEVEKAEKRLLAVVNQE